MHIFVLVLMMAVLAHDPSGAAEPPALHGWAMAAAVLVPYALLAAIEWVGCGLATRSLRVRGAHAGRSLRRLEWLVASIRASALLLFFFDLYALGWLVWLRENIGDRVLLDELLAVAPALASVALGWSFYYPIDRRLREAASAASPQHTPWPIGTRWGFVLSQLRHQVLLIFVPLCAVMAWMELVSIWAGGDPGRLAVEPAIVFCGFAVIFAFAPVMIRLVWDTAPLPPGDLRDRLMALCRDYRVRVRSLLLWRTYGGMINGAVMGLVGPLRYILLTDGLIARMTPFEIEAVMAHELAHVRKRHMVWLVVSATAVVYGLETALQGLVWALESSTWDVPRRWPLWGTVSGAAVLFTVVPLWLAAFGWISRRFERQADAFAVQHLATRYPDGSDPLGPARINAFAVQVYCEALRRVAALNHSPMDDKGRFHWLRHWRHGSIPWRIAYLEGLVGTPVGRVAIDRTVRRICVASAVILLGLLLYYEAL